ncbi:hypothetical protein [Chryseobacterium vrystaatense]|uniref:SMI1 / KNR4 family (SUKH-1) n=1 Tax=Chryseobacterium vrystaatense TaxID=307480 RepID=A0ABR4ULV7_9FLAO|nr:hypothetical protein [Chryseobacterium vrystaatense]KFF25915.1 hypothetical protein IW16_13700 [Chryseobacterium vrystaatense]
MYTKILERLNVLGANTDAVSPEKSFAENWKSLTFSNYLYDKEWDVYGIDQFYENNRVLYSSDKEVFYINLLEHYFSNHEQFYGQHFYKDWLFTPFKEDSKDFGELEGFVEENEIRETVQGTEMEFICIFYSYGYPDHYFVCLTDPDQNNPTVYGTDHENYFEEIENEGNLETFLEKYMTKEEFQEVVKEYLEEKFGK